MARKWRGDVNMIGMSVTCVGERMSLCVALVCVSVILMCVFVCMWGREETFAVCTVGWIIFEWRPLGGPRVE